MAIVVRGDDQEGGWQEPEEAAAITRAQTDPGFSAAFSGLTHNEPTQYLLRRAERSQFDPGDWFFDMLTSNAAAYGAPPDQLPQQTPSPVMKPEDYNKLYAPTDDQGNVVPIGDKPMPELLAKTIGQQMKDKQVADSAVSRFANNHGVVTNMAVNMAADMADPLNIASNLIPVVGEEAVAARLGLSGASFASRTAARAVSGAALGAVTQAPLAGLRAGLAPGENDDYTMGSALEDTLKGSAAMAAMTTGIGSVGDLLKVVLGSPTAWHLQAPQARETLPDAAAVVTADASTNQAAQRSALGQMIDGKPVDVEDLFAKPPGSITATGIFQQQPFDNLNVSVGTAADYLAPQYDRDTVARQLEPELFTQWDDATSRRAWHSSLYHELASRYGDQGGTDVGRQALQDERADLIQKMQSATKGQRARMAQRVGEITDLIGGEGEPEAPAAPLEALPPQVQQSLPEGSIADIDAEVSRLQGVMQTANKSNRTIIAKRIDMLQNQQEELANAIGVPNTAEPVGLERFEEAPIETRPGQTPFVQVPKRPLSLTEFLATQGGIRDQGGDIGRMVDNANYRPLEGTRGAGASRVAGDWRRKLINDNGMTVDDAALHAWEEGYFPEHTVESGERPTINDLKDAIGEELAGHRHYSAQDTADLAKYEIALDHNHEIDQLATQHGIDPNGMSREQFFDRIAARQSVEELDYDIEDRFANYRDSLGEHDLEPGEVELHPERGEMIYEGPRSLEDMEHAERAEQASAGGGQNELPEPVGRSGAAAEQEGLGEVNARSGGRDVGPQRGAGTETRSPATGRGAAERGRSARVTAGDLRVVQQGLIRSDYRMRDLAVRVSDAYKRADDLIRERVNSQTGNILSEIYPHGQAKRIEQGRYQGRFVKPMRTDPFNWQHDLSGMLEREKGWQETGVAPGIDNASLRETQADVKEAASRPLAKDDPAAAKLPKRPDDWGQPAAEGGDTNALAREPKPEVEAAESAGEEARIEAGEGATEGREEPAATTAAENVEATETPLERLARENPDLDIMGMTDAEKTELLAAQNDVDRAERMQGAYEEAAACLSAA